MATRRESSNTLFPFTPPCETNRLFVAGVLDAFFAVPRTGLAAGAPVYVRSYYIYLKQIASIPASVTFTFGAVAGGMNKDIVFTVNRNLGIVRVDTSSTTSHGFLLVDSSNMYSVAATVNFVNPYYVEIEPGRIIWQTDEITSVVFKNEELRWDPNDRGTLATYTLATLAGGPIKLNDGFNCRLSYDEDTETLTINGVPGGGAGLYQSIPWDVAPAPYQPDGIKSVNGITGVQGDLKLEFTQSLFPVYGAAKISIALNQENP
jgi:hypothetical protein